LIEPAEVTWRQTILNRKGERMEVFRRNALLGGLGLLAGTSLSSAARAEGLVPFEGLQDF
jgi:hypothetical protein